MGRHNVEFHRTGAKMLHHPVVGNLTLDYEAPQRILIYSAEPGSPSQQALDLLASWAKRPHHRMRARTEHEGDPRGRS
jgi:MmyB-like transcription regulator ligand binding domain